MDKGKALALIAQEIERCAICKNDSLGKAVPGEGNPTAKIVFIGEAPGKEEAKTGRPFVGRSGKFLRQLIREIGLKEEEVYITSPVKYLPQRGTPTQKDIEHGRIHLQKQLDIIDPAWIVLLGKVAAKAVLPSEEIFITKDHGKKIQRGDKTYFITFHPAAALRIQTLRPLLIKDFQELKLYLHLPATLNKSKSHKIDNPYQAERRKLIDDASGK